MKQYLLGIDIGTSACKTALFTENGEVAATESEGYPVYYPKKGWAEQNPEEWWEAVCRAVRRMLERSGIEASKIAGIGIDGQSWSAIPVDKEGRVLCHTPIWMDTRADEICREIRQSFGEERLFEVSGNPFMPSYSMPKVLWYKKHRPEVYKHTEKILQSNSYIAFCLTGEMTQELSQGYGWQCFHMRKGTWEKELCKEMGIDTSFLPEIFPCHAIIGNVTKKAAQECGLVEGIPVAAGALDAACGTLGAGVLQEGETQEQGGQAGGMSICTKEYRADRRLILSYHATSDSWLLQGGTVGGGGVLRWLERELGDVERIEAKNRGTSSFQLLNEIADKVPAGSDGLIFLPYMAGERSPIWDPDAKGVFYGLDFETTKGHLVRAAMEGVAMSLRHNLETAKEAHAAVKELRAMGGSANSLLWTQIKADVTGTRIVVPSSDTATTLGAVMLAGVGIGMYQSFEEAVKKTVTYRRVHEPNPKHRAVYDKNYETYLGIYENLKDLMKGKG